MNPNAEVYAVPVTLAVEEIAEAEAEVARDAITDKDVDDELERR